MNSKRFSMISSVTDLNRECQGCDPAMRSIVGANYVCGKAGVCANHGASAAAHVSTNCGPLCGRAEGEVVLVPGSVPVHGVRATDLSGESARHRSVPARPALELYHLGIRSTVARNTLANANAVRDWRIYADVAQGLIAIARPLYVDEPFGVDLKESV